MSGHVFHPGHEELHGITVVVPDSSGKTYVGRYHERNAKGVVLHDVAVYDPATNVGGSVEDWLARQRKFGVQVAHRLVIVPTDTVGAVRRLLT